jgi:hypothetical protein
MADKKTLEKINSDPNKLVAQVSEDLQLVVGLRWDDLIIRFEWHHEMEDVIEFIDT